jgi:hypothetical protein
MVILEDVLFVLEQKGNIDMRVRMAKILIREMLKQEKENETTITTKENQSRCQVV